MIVQVDPKTFGESLHFLVGLLIVLVSGSLLGLGIWVGMRLWIARRFERRSWQEFQEQRLAPDGRPYPSFIDGALYFDVGVADPAPNLAHLRSQERVGNREIQVPAVTTR